MEKHLSMHRNNAIKFHNETNCKYDGKPYITHLDMVVEGIKKYRDVFIWESDYETANISGFYHDLIEDAQLTFNDVKRMSDKRVAQVVLAVSDVHDENRLLRHLATMNKTVKDPLAIIVKMADMRANGLYSKTHGSSMYKKYLEEYQYRKPIFQMALKWYESMFDKDVLQEFWVELDEIHDGETKLETESRFDLLYFKNYVNSYTKTNTGCDNDNIILKDMLYGIGVSLDKEKYRMGSGFRKFIEYIKILKLP